MLKGRVPQKKQKSKKQSKEEPFQGKEQSQEVGRMHMRMVELESKLNQAYNLNDLYLTQITHLEQDNLTLCTRLQELKVIHEGKLREYIQENDQLRGQDN